METMVLIQNTGRGRIPLHRSVRYVRFTFQRLAGWLLAAVVTTGMQLYFNRSLTRIYGWVLEGLLSWAGVPFEQGTPDHLAFISTPSWSVTTFNPVAVLPVALAYCGAGLFLALVVWRIPKLPFPLSAWLSLLGVLLLVCTLVMSLMPIPRFTPEVFAGLWMKVTVATALLYPWLWAALLGILPLPIKRVFAWGAGAWVTFALWNAVRLAAFLALARAAGVLWLPLAFILGGTLMDCFVFIVAFSRALEPAGQEWEEPA